MLSKLTLKITNNKGQVVYEGNMLKLNEISLGKYVSGESDNLVFEINVPSDLENVFNIILFINFRINISNNSRVQRKKKEKINFLLQISELN